MEIQIKKLPVRMRRAATLLAPFGTACAYHIPAIAAPEDVLLFETGQFELGNGETKVIHDGKVPEPYRVCVSKGAGAVAVKARYDGAERLVAVGDCADVTGKFIRLSPGGRLKEDDTLIGKFEHLKK